MEINRITVKGKDQRPPEDRLKPKIQIQSVKVNGKQSAGNGQSSEVQQLETQISREEQIIVELQEKLNRKQEEEQNVRLQLDEARRTVDSLKAEENALAQEMQQSRLRQEANRQRLKELRELERASDEEIARMSGTIRERYEKLMKRQETAQADLKMDIAQLGEMKVSEFVDADKVKELEEKYAQISQSMQALQKELRNLSLGAGQEGDKRTDRLNINE